MFDALEDTPRDFQTKLIDALNSLAQTMGCSPEEAFNKVLCRSDDGNEDVKKKLYNWWRAFFEVLGRCEKVPTVRVSEFNEKVDDLMTEIMKAGDGAATDEELVAEEYEQATKDDEDGMLADMKFAIGKIGEIANKVKEIVNFINPWVRSAVGESGEPTKFRVGDKVVIPAQPSLGECVVADVLGVGLSGAIYAIKTRIGIQRELEANLAYADEYNFNEDCNMKLKKIDENRGGDSEWVSMDDIVGMRIGEEEEVNWDDENSYNDGGFEKGMWVIWTDPDGGEESVWKILEMPENPEDFDAVYTLGQKDGSEVEVYGHEIRPRDSDPIEDVEERFDEDGGALDDNQFHDYLMSMKPLKGDIFENYDVYNIDYGKAVELNVLVNKPRVSYAEVEQRYAPIAKNAGWKFVGFAYADKDDTVVAGNDDMCAINVKFSRASNQLNEENTKMKNELKKGDDGWKDMGQPVGEATVTVDANDVWDVLELLDNDIAKKELTDLINSHSRTEAEIMDAINELSGDTISKKELNTLISGRMSTIVDYLGLDVERYEDMGDFVDSDKPTSVELEGTDWKDITEKLTAEELADSIDGWEDRSKKLVVCDAYASGSEIVNVDVLTVTNRREEVVKMASEYLLGNVENWQVADASEPRKDENGQFYTELILEPKYEEVSENNDEVKSGEVKDGEKQVTQGGDTKTLVAGEEKKPVCEMTIEQEVTDPWKLLNLLWGQGKENLQKLLRANLFDEDYIMQIIEDMEIHNLTSINDAFAFDFPTILDMLGCDVDAWNSHLEIKRQTDYDSDDGGDEDEG